MTEDRSMYKMKHYKTVVWQTNEYAEDYNICRSTTIQMKPNWWSRIVDVIRRRKPKEEEWIAFTEMRAEFPTNYDSESPENEGETH